MKICSNCSKNLSNDSFYQKNGKPVGRCKNCVRLYYKQKKKDPKYLKMKRKISKLYYENNKHEIQIKRSGPLGRLWKIKARAKSNNIDFDLVESNLYILKSMKNCEYCSMPLNKCKKFTGVGPTIDRKDCNKGYISGNITVCCMWCNQTKNKFIPFELMKKLIGPIIRKHWDR